MKVNDCICINSGLDVYQTVYTAAAATAAGAVFSASCAAAATEAQKSQGIGKVLEIYQDWIRIEWLKNTKYNWWYKSANIRQNFHVVQNNSIIGTLYG